MSYKQREVVAKLRRRYAKHFNVPLKTVVADDYANGDAEVYCPERKDLPIWSTGPDGEIK